MPSLIERSRALWGALRESPADADSGWMRIPDERVSGAAAPAGALQPDRQYFEVRVNEMYLTYDRQWFKEYDPMVLVVSEFSYAGQTTVVPFVVGPSMMEKLGHQAPKGMVFADTQVAGPHPYRGGDLTVTVILYRTERENVARKLLSLVESTASALDFAGPLSAYTKLAGVVLDGVEALTGTDGTADPLLGRRSALGPDVEPGFYVLASAGREQLANLWVRDRQLVQGPSPEQAVPFRDAEYVLYSVAATDRDDVSALPFHAQWQRVVQEANQSSRADVWESAKANMAALLGMVDTSPDLTETHAAALGEKWIGTMKTLHDRAVRLSSLGHSTGAESRAAPAAAPAGDLARVRARAVSVLHL